MWKSQKIVDSCTLEIMELTGYEIDFNGNIKSIVTLNDLYDIYSKCMEF